jgi:hypothetical protein
MDNVIDFESAKFDRDVKEHARVWGVTPDKAFEHVYAMDRMKKSSAALADLLESWRIGRNEQ